MDVRFPCPVCQQAGRWSPAQGREWVCAGCDHAAEFPAAGYADTGACLVCAGTELYRKKDFPQWLGLTVLSIAFAGFVAAQALYRPWLAWTVLLGSAAVDAGLYLMVGDALVCYRCGARHRGVADTDRHPPFDLGVAERYRQERLRRARPSAGPNP